MVIRLIRLEMLKKLLGFDPQTMALRTEIIAGITTFLTMSYIDVYKRQV